MLIFSASSALCAANSALVRTGISQYKAKNYAGCIYTMKDVIKKDPSNAMAHYYAAISYARLGDKTEASNYYTKVVNLNSNVTLTSYAKQGLAAINNGSQNNAVNAQADKFLQAGYKSGVNPEVTKQLKMMELDRKKDEINTRVHAPKVTQPTQTTTTDKAKDTTKDTKKDSNKPADTTKKSLNKQPTDAEIAQAVKTLAAVGINPLQLNSNNNNQPQIDPKAMQQYQQSAAELAQLQMMLGSQNNNNSYGNNNYEMRNASRDMSPGLRRNLSEDKKKGAISKIANYNKNKTKIKIYNI